MSSLIQHLHAISIRLSNRQWIGAVTLSFLSWLSLGGAVIAQDVQHTQNTADQSLRSDLQVDPSTLGMSIGISLHDYPGRGVNLPITLRYGSKVWRIESTYGWISTLVYITESEARYAEHSAAGWNVSLELPRLEPIGANQPYLGDGSGKPACNMCDPQPGDPAGYVYFNRILMHMPDGSTHELRKDDGRTTPAPVNLAGIYHAVDGSRLKYDADTGTLYLPDGSRYLLNAPGGAQFIDRHGNTLSYNSTSKQWTDTLGRVIGLPPLNDTAAGDYAYQLPGMGGASSTYIFRWRRLRDDATGQTMLTNPNDPSDPNPYNPGASINPLKYPGDRSCQGQFSYPISPSLFNSLGTKRICSVEEFFNPVVLHQIVLPQGSAYTFTYNIYGEIDKVQLPTGGYQRYEYQAIASLSSSFREIPYGQGNRGVVKHWVSADGTTADEKLSQYTAARISNTTYKTTVQGPDGARSERYMHASHPFLVEYGFDDARTGRAYEERIYSATGQMLRRTLTEWTVTGPVGGAGAEPSATRDARVTKQVAILLDTSGDALAQTTTTAYDAALNPISTNSYAFVPVNQTTAQTGAIGAMPAGALLRATESTFLVSDPAITGPYQQRHLLALPTMTRVKDGAGTIVSETQFRYDEAAYPLLTYGVAPPGWTDPATNYRGLVTTMRSWLNHPNGTYLETHAQYDQCGNLRKVWDGNGKITETFYTDSFSDGQNRNTFAYATSVTTPAPDPTGAFGSNQPLTSSTVFEFNTGKVVTTTDANNKTTNYFYTGDGGALDSLQRLLRVTLPDGLGETKYEYGDAPGDLYVRTLTKQNATTWLESRTNFDGLGRAWRSGHYEGPNSWSVTDTEYDALGRVKRVTNPYFAANLSGATPSVAAWTTTTYDDLNRVLAVTTPDGAVVTTAYDGNRVTVTDQAGKQRRSETDALGRLIKVTEDPSGLNYDTTYFYDPLDNLRFVNQGGQGRWFAYDSLSRLIRVKNPEQAVNPNLPPHTDPFTGGAGWAMAYSYDANGNLTQRIDARNVTTNYSYDALNRNTLTTYNISGSQTRSVEMVYDGAANGKGRLLYERTKEGGVNSTETKINSYDALGRPLNKQQSFWRGSDWGTPYVIQQSYDLAGAVKTLTYPSGHTVNYSHDQAGRLSGFSGNLGDGVNRNYATGMQYDAAGLMKREQFGTTIPLYHRRHYNNRLQLFDIRLGTDPNPSYDSDDLNAWQNAAGSWNRGALKLYFSTIDGCHVYGNGGTNNNGNVLRMDHHIPVDDAVSNFVASIDRYDYDSLNRLKSGAELSRPQGPSGEDVYQGVFRQAFLYDRWGNRTIDQANTTGGVNEKAYTVDAATNRLTLVDGVAMSYDAAGNQTNDGSGQRVYNGENRMVEAYNSAGVRVSWYVYDAAGRRVVRTVGSQGTWQVYGCGGELLAEYAVGASPSAAQKEYGYRNGQLLVIWDGSEPGDKQLQWLVQDHLGSTRMVVDRSGSLTGVRRHDYLPFGEELSAGIGIRSASIGYSTDSTRQKFTSHERDDETKFDFMQARYYASAQGRFVSPDEAFADQDQSNPQSWNLYSYARNNPLRYIDEDGRAAETPEEKKKREEREKEYNRIKYGLPMTNKELKDTAELSKQFIDQVNQSQTNRDINGNVIVINTYGMSDGGIVLLALEIGNALYGDQLRQLDLDPTSISSGTKRTPHGERRKKQADAGDTRRQVGDANRTIRKGKHYIDTETGNNVYVRGNKVVITNNQGTIVSQFKNTRANTLDRVNRGKWKPVS